MVDQTPLIGDEGGTMKRGQGSACCDSKRGIITVNAIALVLTAIGMAMLSVGYNDPDLEKKVVDEASMDWLNKNYVPFMIVNGIAIVINLIAIYGASIYNIFLVLLGAVYIIVRLVYTLVIESQFPNRKDIMDIHWFDIVWPIIWALYMLYWHVLFIFEVKKGIMSPQTYPREKHSCCCSV
mmetsp:Transcript_30757/g.53398  ORF Transcript_30757/g.53398 Transcript_30757/m.53398 type:complete len:181 (+) Transcript_30757:103-645(+)|eukprot:CAMPEP_0201894026 /NCGR_PEP_ID=MMETSP0902-20130614/39930_1 /ASSEMBLY_ACC=CAM_ASM_000551 /TAXON_ID=420261 /ORGANISM="Thalassiosira antarctica, Strain CCMP982" /LENGTH=180 /DNA_ID=CAMNT_0048425989 /DNA_START=55 /DNA_END=597 /DNA_ORIENTATION=+